MTFEQVQEIRHKQQIVNNQDQADYVMLLGAALAGYAHLPLTVRNCLMMGSAALKCLPASPEEAVAAKAVYLPDLPDPRLTNL